MTERKTERAKQLLVRYIRDKKIKSGEKLPSQNELRRTFKFGSATICSAINALKEDGVLEVRDKVGVFVLDPDAGGHAGRVIGITLSWTINSLYYSSLLTHLQLHLMQNGCSTRLFRRSSPPGDGNIFGEIDDYPGLYRSLKQQEIQGLIHLDDFTPQSLNFIKSQNIPLVFIGSPGGIAANGVMLDHAGVVKAACLRLKKMGAGRSILICQECIRPCVEKIFCENAPEKSKIFSGSATEMDSVFCREYLAMPETERPDWLICLDDWLALSCLSGLAREIAPEKMPGAVIMCNAAAGFRYPVRRLIFYNNDLNEFSSRGVDLLMKAMRSGNPETGCEMYLPQEYKSTY